MKRRAVSGLLSQLIPSAIVISIAALFLILNRGAYQGYFQDDDLSTLAWIPHVSGPVWLNGFFTPAFLKNNFRPAGHIYYLVLWRAALLRFPIYVAALQAFHLFNAFLVSRLARVLGLNWGGAVFASVFFVLSAAALDAYWKPMYVFDVLCTTFCLLSLLCYTQRRWVISFAAFWLAYKSKELAVMLPAVFLIYEFALGERKWKRLIPFLALSLSFGIQGILFNPNKENEYAFHFSWPAIAATTAFHSSRILLVPYGGFALLALAAVLRDRRAWFGVAASVLFFVPLIFLPGRLYPAYVYLPEVGASLVLAIAFSKVHYGWALVFFAVWLPWNVRELKIDRKATLALAEGTRPYVAAIMEYARSHPEPPQIIFQNAPPGFHNWGVLAVPNIAWNRLDLVPLWRYSAEGERLLAGGGDYVFMFWNPPTHRMRFEEHRAVR